jgi:hypothetical protein
MGCPFRLLTNCFCPACICYGRDRVQPLLRSLCCGVADPELVPAVSGLLSGSAAVRATALTALPHVPTLAEGVAPESEEVVAVLALSRHDVNEDNAAAAETLWEQVRLDVAGTTWLSTNKTAAVGSFICCGHSFRCPFLQHRDHVWAAVCFALLCQILPSVGCKVVKFKRCTTHAAALCCPVVPAAAAASAAGCL